MELNKLNRSELRVLASVKANMLMHLLEILSEYDTEIQNLLEGKQFRFGLQSLGGPLVSIRVSEGRIKVQGKRRPSPEVRLWFLSNKALCKMLSGQKAFVVPRFRTLKVGSILKTFRACTTRLQYYLKAEEQGRQENFTFMTKLLLNATVNGIKQVAELDSYVAQWVRLIKDGVIEIFVENNSEIGAHIIKRGKYFDVERGRAPSKGNVQLIFKNVATAYGMLTGNLNPYAAIGAGDLKIRGFIPMIQHLFAILGRLNYYMSVE